MNLDELVLIAVQSENPWLWLGVCKRFWLSHTLIEKLLKSPICSIDQKFFAQSMLNYGSIYSEYEITTYTIAKGFEDGDFPGVQLQLTEFTWEETLYYGFHYEISRDLCRLTPSDEEYWSKRIFEKDEFTHLQSDILSYHSILQNRIEIITGISPKREVLRKLCSEYFEAQLRGKDVLQTYLLCIMTGRLMGMELELKLSINSITTSNEEDITHEIQRVSAQIDKESLSNLLHTIRIKINQL